MTSISNAKMSVNSWTPTVENPEPIPPIILHSCNYTRIKNVLNILQEKTLNIYTLHYVRQKTFNLTKKNQMRASLFHKVYFLCSKFFLYFELIKNIIFLYFQCN